MAMEGDYSMGHFPVGLVITFMASIALLMFMFYTNAQCRYWIKMTVYNMLLMIISIVLMPLILLRFGDVANCRTVMYSLRKIVAPYFGIKFNIQGREHLKDSTCIIVSNHQSSLDVLVMASLWPDRCTSLAKRELMYAGPLGLLLLGVGTIFINRAAKDSAKTTMQKAAEIVKSKNTSVWIFPEGTRNHDGTKMLDFKKGAFHLAVEAQVPIVPVVVGSYQSFYDKNVWKFSSGSANVQCLEPIKTEGLTTKDVESLTKFTQQLMGHCFNQISQFDSKKTD